MLVVELQANQVSITQHSPDEILQYSSGRPALMSGQGLFAGLARSDRGPTPTLAEKTTRS